MERVDLLRRLNAIRRLSRANPLSSGESRLETIGKLVSGEVDALTVLRRPRFNPAEIEKKDAETKARKARGGRDRMERGGQDRNDESGS